VAAVPEVEQDDRMRGSWEAARIAYPEQTVTPMAGKAASHQVDFSILGKQRDALAGKLPERR
jgi:hypothetical protein